METWDWLEKEGTRYFVSNRGSKKKNGVRFSVYDLVEASVSDDYSELKVKYLLSDRDVSILKTALRNGRWNISPNAFTSRASLN